MMLTLLAVLLGLLATAPASLVPRDTANNVAPTTRQARGAALLQPRPVSRGLNGEECEKSSECRGDRLCVVRYAAESSHLYVCDSPKKECICLDPNYLRTRCTATRGCETGERCFHRKKGAKVGLCFSCDAFDDLQGRDEDVEPLGDGNCDGENDAPPPSSDVSELGLNGDSCNKTTECAGGRFCFEREKAVTSSSSAYVCDSDKKDCICLKSNFLADRCQGETASVRCDPGERCYKSDNSTAGLCYSCKALKRMNNVTFLGDGNCGGELTGATGDGNSTSGGSGSGAGPASPAPCIGVHHLGALSRDSLVFSEHVSADVVCDARGSCATRGHVVVFNGRAMMMGTYCARHARCSAARMLVNSPRMGGRGLRVASHTDGLEYTVFSARYETALEEQALRALVHVGL